MLDLLIDILLAAAVGSTYLIFILIVTSLIGWTADIHPDIVIVAGVVLFFSVASLAIIWKYLSWVR